MAIAGLGASALPAQTPSKPPVRPLTESEADRGADDPELASGKPVRCQRGFVIRAEGGSMRNILGTMAIPADLPDRQKVRKVKEELPRGATVTYKNLDASVRQMAVRIPALAAGAEARAVVTFEVELFDPPPLPADAEQFVAPQPARLARNVSVYLAPSPLIESGNPAVRQLAEKIVPSPKNAWDTARAIHAWVYTNIKFQPPPDFGVQSTLETIEKCTGVCAEKNSLVVALLRACRIPARLIRITSESDAEHCYYEFYLVHADGRGQWFTGDASNTPVLAPSTGKKRIVLQIGDSVMVQDPATHSPIRQRFLGTTLSGLPNAPGAQLQLKMIGQ